ncbi:DUF692 domain-containing protein [Pinirhizobacter sp.]|jgi:hypothetical protein|uniref:MNIO family bufferin maturase n=1 Tax=Pinirhizobacter sp. TaxID=2950432 RepID=UPI002F430042
MRTSLLGAGLGLKLEHFPEALDATAEGLWFEVHPENYMVDGGPRRLALQSLAARHPLSLHGVSLSLAADVAPDAAHLARLRELVQRVQPVLVSEHLAWSTWRGEYAPDLLPFPRNHQALARITDNIQRTQEALGRAISVENPSHYVHLDGHDFSETDFLTELARRSGCGLLLDINNVHVSARNLGTDALGYLDAFPVEAVTEIHLAGHAQDPVLGPALLVDSHDAPVGDEVWQLFRHVIARVGAVPVLIERDGNIPSWEELMRERAMAAQWLPAKRQAA